MVWLALALAHANPTSPHDIVRLVQDGHTCAGSRIQGTDRILTAYHCVVGGRRVRVFAHDGGVTSGRVVAVDPQRDVAWVEVSRVHAGGVSVAQESPAVGQQVYAIGHPYGAALPSGFFEGTLRNSVSDGIISAIGPRSVQTTAPINPGNSGGPLLLAQTGEVIGVVSRRVGRDGVGFAGRLRDAEDGYTVFGGRVMAGGLATYSVADDGVFTLGGRLQASLRDRVWFRADAAIPIDSRWDAVRFGSAQYRRAAGTVVLSQPILRGTTPMSVSVHGGVAAHTSLTGASDPVRTTRRTVAAPHLGGGVAAFGLTVEASTTWVGASLATQLSVAVDLPGTLTVW